MDTLKIGAGILLLLLILSDTFETIVLPRTVTRKVRLTRLYYLMLWGAYGLITRNSRAKCEEPLFSNAFGPLSLLLLIVLWASGLIFGFALVTWGLGSPTLAGHLEPGLFTDTYLSGTTFFTLGLGDVTPTSPAERVLIVFEAGVGFGFLAIVIGYLPIIYQSFSRREAGITLLDSRSGSPPTAGEMIRRHAAADSMDALTPLLLTMEAWASDFMESHLSYPVLVFYRSQHDRESWLATLTVMLDVSALILVGFEDKPDWQRALRWQAKQTYAMCRHVAVDLALVLQLPVKEWKDERLPNDRLARLRAGLTGAGLKPRSDPQADARLRDLRQQYEPYLYAMGDRLHQALPPWIGDDEPADNWRTGIGDQDSHL
ncbi:MAG: hypothetical protein JWL77_3446 [Chthonomonadaceae bacterium]|nr:hypothetical protein [Chthonomonadaceae bacterium]